MDSPYVVRDLNSIQGILNLKMEVRRLSRLSTFETLDLNDTKISSVTSSSTTPKTLNHNQIMPLLHLISCRKAFR